MSSLIDVSTIAIWAEDNVGIQAAVRQRIQLPGGLYPVLFGTGATVAFIMRGITDGVIDAGVPKVNYSAGFLIDPTDTNPDTGLPYDNDANDTGHGWIGYSPAAADTDAPGNYVYRFRLTFADTSVVSFPNKDWKRLDVTAEDSDPAPFPA